MTAQPQRDDVAKAAACIRPWVRETPVLRLPAGLFGPARVVLKLECLQATASFKVRGTFNSLVQRQDGASRGVIAASGGNHGIAVAYAAAKFGVTAEIFVPTIIGDAKLARLKASGAQVHRIGARYAESLAAMRERQAATGALEVHAFDQAEVVAGQGTMTAEFERQAPECGHLLIAVGGGGLIAGALTWLGNSKPVIAVEPEHAPTLARALDAGQPIDVEVGGIAADSLGAKRIGEIAFAKAREFQPHPVLVSDAAIREAQRRLFEHCRVVAEPGGATALAALTSGAWHPADDQPIGIVICGGNTDPASLSS